MSKNNVKNEKVKECGDVKRGWLCKGKAEVEK